MLRRPPYAGRSKATPTTQCQKCLKRGHYSYECTVSAQERPYKARPSRTQQLLNPNLRPKPTEDVPVELLHKKGIADELLAKKEQERGRGTSHEGGSRKRSYSTSSSDSVSTISTNRSRSRSPPTRGRRRSRQASLRDHDILRKRERSRSFSSYGSEDGEGRNVRRRLSSFSPPRRGRTLSVGSNRSSFRREENRSQRTNRRRASRSRSDDRGRGRRRFRSRSMSRGGKRPGRDLSMSRSPYRSPDRMDFSQDLNPQNIRGGAVDGFSGRGSRSKHYSSLSRSRSCSRSRHRKRKATTPSRDSRSPSPYSKRRETGRSPSPFYSKRDGSSVDNRRGDRVCSTQEGRPGRGASPPIPPRQRSLSPYSKRVAMTRAMQGR
ncbi:uncharacterized protein EI97DRAFT_502100 [Westerdykella ornata]|uniref:Zinc knuckle-domain-containing protein n=1 Tax=Westerdykella ornata TaxID=318751 RepID=A0A6A6JGA1_WESOR|nr:uncharacterized protein EI97DRAFT_502100 [Westerdykella ornata]KAF2275153.1 hypothetical protein EI97DRAFT_502100 [Westerdykella ornata]